MTKPNLQDVAKFAGVGTSTASRVLNNHPNTSDRSRQKVLVAVKTLGYIPNLEARSFRSGQTNAVSVLLPTTGTAFYDTLFGAIYNRIEKHNLDLALFPLLGLQRVRRFRESSALIYRADALLIASQNPDQLYEGRPPFSKPIVLVDVQHPQYHSIFFDNFAAGIMAAEIALGRGLPIVILDEVKTPAALGSPVFIERRRGVQQTLGRCGVTPSLTLEVTTTLKGIREAALQLLLQRPTEPFFILAFSDDIALGVNRQLESAGLRVGKDYLILGFDGSETALDVGLSSIGQPLADMGYTTADVLIKAMQGELKTIVQKIFSPTFIEAKSTTLLGKIHPKQATYD